MRADPAGQVFSPQFANTYSPARAQCCGQTGDRAYDSLSPRRRGQDRANGVGGVGAFAEAEPSRRRFDAGTPASVSSPRATPVPIVRSFLLAFVVEGAAASSDRSLDSSASRAKSCAANSVFCARSGAHGSGASPAALARWTIRSIASAHMSDKFRAPDRPMVRTTRSRNLSLLVRTFTNN
jgi:hypothetical protein